MKRGAQVWSDARRIAGSNRLRPADTKTKRSKQTRPASYSQEAASPEPQLQQHPRKQCFTDTAEWRDHRYCRPTPCKPESSHKGPQLAALSLSNPRKHVRADSRAGSMVDCFDLKSNSDKECTSVCGPAGSAGSNGQIEMCRKLCDDGPLPDAVDALEGLLPHPGCCHLFYRVLKRCIQDKHLALGSRVHALIAKSGYEGDAFLATHLINLYAVHGKLDEAMKIFSRVPTPDAYNWTTIISAYARHGQAAQAAEAVRLYRHMRQWTAVKADDRLYSAVLKACACAKDVAAGRQVHAHILASSQEPDKFVQAGLVNMYAKCGSLEDARTLFDELPDKNVVTWNAMIAGYAKQGRGQEALTLYRKMQQEGVTCPDSVTYVCLLQACSAVGVGGLDEGRRLHAEIKQRGLQEALVLGTSLVNMYAKCGSLQYARGLFDSLREKNVMAWNSIIAGYVQQGMGLEALGLYRSMQQEGLTPPDSVTYVCLLRACANLGVAALDQGQQLHADIQGRGLEEESVLGCSLVNMYCKCSSLGMARRLFDKLAERNIVAWNAMIAGYAQHGMGREAFSLYKVMQQESVTSPDPVTYVCLLQACANLGVAAVDEGKQLHAQIIGRGLEEEVAVGGSLVNMYAKCGRLGEARIVFDELSNRNVVTWNAMIAGYVQEGMGEEALSLYRSMRQEGLTSPDSVTYVSLLQACAIGGVEALDEGKQVHADIEEQGLQDGLVVRSSLVNMYAKCGSLDDARMLFDKLPQRDIVLWNAMIAGYTHLGMGEEALCLYRSMQQGGGLAPDVVTYVCLLQACASVGVGALDEGKQLHAEIIGRGLQEDEVVGRSLVSMYARCGSLANARRLFDQLSARCTAAWNAIITGYAQQGLGEEALGLFRRMQEEGLSRPDVVTFVGLLQACASVGVRALDEGSMLHAHIRQEGLEGDMVLGGSLVNMYAKCGELEEARVVFDKLPKRNVVAWNAMIGGYARQGQGDEALKLYRSMQKEGVTPDSVSYVCVLQACVSSGVGGLDVGKQLHAEIKNRGLEEDLVMCTSLMNMYAKCGSVGDARGVFDKLPERNLVAWNSMVAGYAQQGMGQEALDLYRGMQQEGLAADAVTYVCLLQACAAVACLPLGKQLHAEIEGRGMQAEPSVGAALVNMYAKCGSITDAQQVFDSLPERGIEAWGALLSGYSRQGDSQAVFDLLDRMATEGVHPDEVMFLSVLTVCSHVGLVDKGREYLEAMQTDHGISASMEHFVCLVDLLGRAGHLDEALAMAKSMPFPPNGALWRTLLGACLKWRNVKIGQEAFEGAVGVDEKDAASYVLMSNIYANCQMWEAAEQTQTRRKRMGAWKELGQSWWTDMGGVVHTSAVGREEHPASIL